jgi:signal transduction histidine kinase
MSMTQTVEEDFAVPIHLEVPHALESVALTGAIADTVVGAAREALINAAKHAGKCRISLSCLVGSDRLQVRIVDDGLGQLSRPLGYGLQAHRRRIQGHGGVIRIERPPGRGTRVLISVPLEQRAGSEVPAAD